MFEDLQKRFEEEKQALLDQLRGVLSLDLSFRPIYMYIIFHGVFSFENGHFFRI